ncbi:GGDEF domain-containing protein [uncultured Selenomonas sp.]|uniref:GGDEF domain-containing protein n=1 Tax=uncultured Selenomonas sp. TaxID=159275 RepID=UPI0025CE4E4B|nr:GGDEF domain-containing protein [uncultured Selenomonas sp.]
MKSSDEHLSPGEKVYPLKFLCDYVMQRREELTGYETQDLKEAIQIMHSLESLVGRLDADCQGASSIPCEKVLAARQELVEMHDAVERHRRQLTKKGLIFEDMSHMLKQAEPLIHRMVFYDSLVNAYNRYFYVSYSTEMFHSSKEHGGLSLAFFDIDNFKQYNTDFGHETGDLVLQLVCDLIQRKLQWTQGLYLIRMGGDEFVILDEGVMDYAAFLALLSDIRQSIVDDRSIHGRAVSISMGVANAEKDGAESTWDLYRLADARLYRAKNLGKNRVVDTGDETKEPKPAAVPEADAKEKENGVLQ